MLSTIGNALKRLFAAIGNAVIAVVCALTWLFTRLVNFFGVIGSITIVGLLIGASVLTWAWQHEELRPLLSAIAGGLSVVLAAIAGFIETKAEPSARWILVAAAGIFAVWFSWYTTDDLTDQLKAKTEIADLQQQRIQLLRDDIVDYVKPLPTDEYRRILTVAGFDKLRSRFNDAITKHSPPFRSLDFEPSRDIIYIINRLEGENKNGHALYLTGEIERILKHPDRGSQRFYTYLEIENNRTRDGVAGATPCRTPEGFCRERTAYIFHLLANNFYQDGLALKAVGRTEATYKESFSTALKHACTAIKLFPPNGFNQTTSERTLEKLLFAELGMVAPSTPPGPGACLQAVAPPGHATQPGLAKTPQ